MKYDESHIKTLALELLDEAGFRPQFQNITAICQGGNNRLFHIKHTDQEFVLKKYYQDSRDPRDRLETEYSFLKLAYDRSPKYVPKTFAKNAKNAVAIYEFINGTKLKNAEEIQHSHISQAAEFIRQLNKNRSKVKFENASDACFSIDEHLNLVETRINELNKDLVGNEMFDEIKKLLNRTWLHIKKNTYAFCESKKISTSQVLEPKNKILSPSDFGFHNAIIKSDGTVVFIDFEYAGWDDPAKLAGDFFNQVEIPINPKFSNHFLSEAFNFYGLCPKNQGKILVLHNVYRIKWCCIVLNIFLEKNLARRIFSNPNLNIEFLKSKQLNKAKLLLERLNNDLH